MLKYPDSTDKSHFRGETRRICSPQETYERIKPFLPIMGITRIANITGLDRLGIPVYTACRPNSRSISLSQGKGLTPEAARISAVMETIEVYHAESIHSPLKLGSYNELRYKNDVADIYSLPKPADSLFTPNTRLLWIEGFDILSQENKWVPFETVHLDYRAPFLPGQGCFISSSNGLSSGNHVLEAMIHGICELIERDALTLWSLQPPNKQNTRKVDINTIRDERCLSVLDKFSRQDIQFGIWEITSNLGIPAFLCRILPKVTSDVSGIRPASGMGCHLSKDIALLRALTEAAQSRLTFISGGRDDLNREDYKKFLTAEEYFKWHKTIVETSAPLRDFRQIPTLEKDTLEQDLNTLKNNLKNNGISEAIMIDLTKEEFGIPVIRMVIPGLESFLSSKEIIFGQRAGQIFRGS